MPPPPPMPIDAGPFGEWLTAMRGVLRGEREADVPCGECIGCCVSSYPIPLRPQDAKARLEVPEHLLIGPAAPGERWLMGFREDGSCPFMQQRKCEIYADRPQTCRDYDCRIYAATGQVPDGDRAVINERVQSWEFTFQSEAERAESNAVERAAQFIRANAALFPATMRVGSATAVAVLAVKSYALFMNPDATKELHETVRHVTEAVRDFDKA